MTRDDDVGILADSLTPRHLSTHTSPTVIKMLKKHVTGFRFTEEQRN